MERPFYLKGNINIKEDYIIGSVIKNQNIAENKERFIQVLDEDNIDKYEEGYKAYIFASKPNKKIRNYSYNINQYETLEDFDVILINSDLIRVLYRSDSDDNALVVTNQCNSNCIMCPDSDYVRESHDNVEIEVLLEQVKYIPSDAKYITITGGEPGMLKLDLIKLLSVCQENLPKTEFLLLTNGRVFANKEYLENVSQVLPKYFRFGIPLYADNAKLHDSITRVPNSFAETTCALKRILAKDIDTEIRIVVLKKNYKNLPSLAHYIIDNFPEVKMVNIMGLEMLGNSYKNRAEVWINYKDIKEIIYETCKILIASGIVTNIYNIPLCQLDKRLYFIAKQSITDYKVRYKPGCEFCKAKDICGGFFFSNINIDNIEVEPIK